MTPPNPAERRAALPTPAQFTALQEIKRGTVVLRERSLGSSWSVSGSQVRISIPTLRVLESRKWIRRDTSTSLYRGQAVSLTPRGEAALEAARTAGPRVSAALRRSRPASDPNPSAAAHRPVGPSVPPAPATKPSRSR
ncbi:hypothetical protein ACFV0C_00325 [Streptomyces sp. NPDC059568]|uniref:hypothetical protein n=1 Tax=Streptomyces sp. NPDC059568 TaxID=3346868 RepID=UPI0036A74262